MQTFEKDITRRVRPANSISSGRGVSMPAVPVQTTSEEQPKQQNLLLQGKFHAQMKEDHQPLQIKPFQFVAEDEKLPLQKMPNNTGLPNNLKAGVERPSGFSMNNVRVNYNSAKPAQLHAFSYAQGTGIHIGSGQERHLPHEAWHVAQQKQGRVQPTLQMKEGVAVNDDKGLEQEADVMGGKALQMKNGRQEIGLVAIGNNATIQRAVIAPAPNNGLAANMDTALLSASKAQVDTLWNGGKFAALTQLRLSLLAALSTDAHRGNNQALRDYITSYLNKTAASDKYAGQSGYFETAVFDYKNPGGDETGITQQPGQGEVLPLHATPLQTFALQVRSWQIGDIVDSIGWSQLGAHLQNRMSAAEYIQLGADILLWRDLKNSTNNLAAADDPAKMLVATTALNRVTNEVRGAIDGLPKREGESYRAATSAAGVYGSAINVGDYIKDLSFWSTSGLRLSHKGSNFGDEGTVGTPKIYYIITGSTGVFVPRFTNKETSVSEVLYKNETVFMVTKITNYANKTVFVHVSEKDPNTAPLIPVTKDPWTGANN